MIWLILNENSVILIDTFLWSVSLIAGVNHYIFMFKYNYD